MATVYKLKSVLICLTIMALTGCGSSSSGGGGGGGGSASPSINTSGGRGGNNDGTGGNGGAVAIEKYRGIGALEIRRSGSVNPAIPVIDATPVFGPHKLEVTSDLVVELNPMADVAADTAYLLSNNNNLFISDGDGNLANDPIVTGMHIRAGATLTLPINYAAGNWARFYPDGDMLNEGRITIADASPAQRGNLDIWVYHYFGSGSIATHGTQPGQHGGWINIDCHRCSNSGAITSYGADDVTSGGNGGNLSIRSLLDQSNLGDIRTDGGNSTTGNGGNAGQISLESYYTNVGNSGRLSAKGGDGMTAGGVGGQIYLFAGRDGWESDSTALGGAVNNGNIDTSGGSASAGNGGLAGDIFVEGYGGPVAVNASITASGGHATGNTGDGGAGGNLIMLSNNGGFDVIEDFPAESLFVAGGIDVRGGDAATGGSGNGGAGGNVSIQLSQGFFFPTIASDLRLLGITNISTRGGDANSPGNGGNIIVTQDPLEVGQVTGPIVNEADWDLTGGSVAAGSVFIPGAGGFGGDAAMAVDTDLTTTAVYETVTNSGDINTSGGNAMAFIVTPASTNAGSILIDSMASVNNSGNLTANGGSDPVNDNLVTTGFGYKGSDNMNNGMVVHPTLGIIIRAWLTTTAEAFNTGVIRAEGGFGEALGGTGGGIHFGSVGMIENNSTLSARGGDADVGITGSAGGDGGYARVASSIASCVNNGTVDASGGAGDTPGAVGTEMDCI